MDPLTRGSIFHRVQAEFFRGLRRAGALPITTANVQAALRVLDGVVAREASAWREELAPAIDRVWDDDIEDMRRDLRVWVERQTTAPEWRAEDFAVNFALSGPRPDQREAPGTR